MFANVEDTVGRGIDTAMVVDMKDAGRAFEALREFIGAEERKLGQSSD